MEENMSKTVRNEKKVYEWIKEAVRIEQKMK